MRKTLFTFLVTTLVAVGVSSCSSYVYPKPINTLQSTPTTQTTPKYDVNNACEQAIVEFLQANPCKEWDKFHNLFTPDSRHFQSTPMASNDPACNLKTSDTILRIMPADEWWKSENPDQPLPEAAKPTHPDELVFFVEYNTLWQPGVVPAGENPGQMLMWMVFDHDNRICLIRDFGW